MKSGIINVYKEAGYTSHDVVAKLRGILKIKKIGHTGTLDPDATGVLPICIGKATKVCDLLTNTDKEYVACMRLGVITDTYDISGSVIEKRPVITCEEDITEVINSFVGLQEQVPPMYSALKVNGKKLYELARAGIEIERKPRTVNIYSIDIMEIAVPFVKFRVNCSKGTYIRSLCFDIGNKLGCGACMESLVRTKVGDFGIDDALKLDEITRLSEEGVVESKINNIDSVFSEYKPVIIKDSDIAIKAAVNGSSLKLSFLKGCEISEGEHIRLYLPDERFLGIYQRNNDSIKLIKMFLE